jgi:TrmH family RNA methyltransferase
MIVSRQNQKIKDIRRLRRCKGDQAILEGPHLVGEAIQAGVALETILATGEFLSSVAASEILANQDRSLVTEVSPHLMDYVCDADSPRGILAIATLPRGGLDSIPLYATGLYLFVDGIQDPGNLGALVRVAEAFAVSAVVLAPGTAHPNHSRSLRASAGSLLRVDVFTDVDPQALEHRLAPIDPKWLVLVPRSGAPVPQLDPQTGVVLVVGSEGPGVSMGVQELAHTPMTIPLAGQVESLNSTVAAAIALYELRRLNAD